MDCTNGEIEERVIGIDPGSRCTGYGVIASRGARLECVTYGCIRMQSSCSIPERLVSFADNFEKLLDSMTVSAMAIESLFTGKNVQSILKLGQFRGVALMLGARRDLSIAEYSPATIKQTLVGYGRATKSQIQYIVQKILHLQEIPQPADAADALAVAICHLNMTRINRKIRRER